MWDTHPDDYDILAKYFFTVKKSSFSFLFIV
jgi:hypothetical protein